MKKLLLAVELICVVLLAGLIFICMKLGLDLMNSTDSNLVIMGWCLVIAAPCLYVVVGYIAIIELRTSSKLKETYDSLFR